MIVMKFQSDWGDILKGHSIFKTSPILGVNIIKSDQRMALLR